MATGQFEGYEVFACSRDEIRDFIETWHYSGSINGVMSTHCFKLVRDGEIIGAMLFGSLGMANAWRKYADYPQDVIELRRLCCIDDTPRNTESFFIGRALRWLKQNTFIRIVVSYADPNHGHSGIIYKASNFKLLGRSAAGKVILYEGRTFHDKAIRTTYNGKLKPFAERLKAALEAGEAHYEAQEGKYIYAYRLKAPRVLGLTIAA